MRTRKFKLIGKSIFFPREKLLAIADLHIGHEEALNKAGIFVPRIQFSEIIADLNKIFSETGKLNEIIICGDLKHEFSTISEQEWKETYKLIEFLKEKTKKIILVRGNHDKILGRLSEKIEIKDYYISNNIVFAHGDRLFPEMTDKKIKTIVIGHRHPAVYISDKYKKEKYKCFLAGKFKGKEIIILPSFFPLIEGTDFIEENNMLFIPEKNLKNFSVYVVSGSKNEVLDFGRLKDINRLS